MGVEETPLFILYLCLSKESPIVISTFSSSYCNLFQEDGDTSIFSSCEALVMMRSMCSISEASFLSYGEEDDEDDGEILFFRVSLGTDTRIGNLEPLSCILEAFADSLFSL